MKTVKSQKNKHTKEINIILRISIIDDHKVHALHEATLNIVKPTVILLFQ